MGMLLTMGEYGMPLPIEEEAEVQPQEEKIVDVVETKATKKKVTKKTNK